MEESVFSQSPFSNESSSKGPSSGRGKKILFLLIILIVLGAVAFGAVKLLGNTQQKVETPAPTPTIEVIPTEGPTATPEAKLTGTITPTPTKKAGTTPTVTPKPTSTSSTGTTDKSKLSVTVQNGSGVTGAAKKMGDLLTSLGYTITTIGNADTSDYAQTEIHVKAAQKDLLPSLKKDLGANYTIGTAVADYTGTGDILVIVGKE